MENIMDTYHVRIALRVCYTDVQQLYIQILKIQESYISITEEILKLFLISYRTGTKSI